MDRKRILDDILEYAGEQQYSTDDLVNFINGLTMEVLGAKYKDKDKLYVLKNRGIIEEYDSEKIYFSLANITYKQEKCMTESEIYLAIKYIDREIKKLDRCIVTTNELREILVSYLEENGYYRVVKLYSV